MNLPAASYGVSKTFNLYFTRSKLRGIRPEDRLRYFYKYASWFVTFPTASAAHAYQAKATVSPLQNEFNHSTQDKNYMTI
jgi:hypothetical protein